MNNRHTTRKKKAKNIMQFFNLIVIVAATLILAFIVTLFAATRRSLFSEDEIKEGKHPQGYFLSIGMVTCIALGIFSGFLLGSVPVGAAIGIGFGLVIGQFLEKRFNSDSGPFTEEEKRERLNRKRVGSIAMCILVFFTLAAAVLSLTR